MQSLLPLIRLALTEDIGPGDLTTLALVPEGARAVMTLVAKQPLVMAGGDVPGWVMAELSADVQADVLQAEGARVNPGDALVRLSGSARALLSGERVALNLLQRACGVATLTRAYVDAVAGTGAKILDTRKTMPGLRTLDKHAVACGGGVNHRFGLFDAVMVKDNHLGFRGQWAGGSGQEVVKHAISAVRAYLADKEADPRHPIPVILECDTLAQVEEALAAGPDRILLDNMPPAVLREAVAMVAGRIPLEASGGMTLANVREVAETGVDYISIGALTHSAPAADISGEVGALG